jgi:hypothetical protein
MLLPALAVIAIPAIKATVKAKIFFIYPLLFLR